MKRHIEFIKDVYSYKKGDHREFNYRVANDLIEGGYAKDYKEPKKEKKKDK